MKSALYHSGAKLSLTDTYPADERCPICGTGGSRGKVLRIQREPEIWLLACPQCCGYSASHMPTREALDRYYGSYYDHLQEERITFHKPIRLARRIASGVELSGVGDVEIMDFGGGDGTIATLTARMLAHRTGRRVQVQVVDYLDGSPRTEGLVHVEYLRDLAAVRAKCDVVIASAVFEHIPDLVSVLPDVFEKLKVGGYLYARTPYVLPFMKALGVDMTYPGHVHDLGHRFWNRLPSWLSLPVDLVRSQTSIVESGLLQAPVRTLAAHTLKLPTRIESLWTANPWFRLYGGWEAFLRRRA